MARNDIDKIGSDYALVWQELINSGLNTGNEFSFDFDFYSGKEKKILALDQFLKEIGYHTSLKVVRTAIVFRGYELRATLNGLWTQDLLFENLQILCNVSNKFDILFEGYGAKIEAPE